MRRKFSRGKVGDDQGTYSAYTRQASNFVFPNITDKVNGETRPRPGNFMMSEKEFEKLNEGKSSKIEDLVSKNKEALNDYIKATQNFLKLFTKYCDDLHAKDKNNKHTILNDIETYIKKRI